MAAHIQPQIQPIQTCYRGFLFRSRLEARWAVFFDSMGITFEYEPQGFQLPNGKRYLPDFLLTHLDIFAEVKPNWPNATSDLLKAQEFVMGGMSKAILFLVGPPDFTPYNLFRRLELPDENESWLTNVTLDIHGLRPRRYRDERRLFEGFDDDDFTGEECFGERYRDAVFASRSARFEFGS